MKNSLISQILGIEKLYKVRGDIINRAYVLYQILLNYNYESGVILNKDGKMEFTIKYKKKSLTIIFENASWMKIKVDNRCKYSVLLLGRRNLIPLLDNLGDSNECKMESGRERFY